MTLQEMNLNLLVTLDVLLRERNVSRAAETIGRSQPAMSHALAKLREYFDDQLLIPTHGGMRLTPFAQELEVPLQRALREVQVVLDFERGFAPETTQRVFGIGCPDALGVLLADLLTWMQTAAPRASLDARFPNRHAPERELELGHHDITLAPTLTNATSALRQLSIGEVQWKLLMRRGHPLAREHTTLCPEQWVAYPHVVVVSGNRSTSSIEAALSASGLKRTIGLSVPGFLLGPRAVASTDMIMAAPHIVAMDALKHLDLIAVDPPLTIPGVHVSIMWHERWDADPGHQWFREGVAQVVRAHWGSRR